MKIEIEHNKRILMSWTKDRLAEQVIRLEHNNNSLQESMDIHYEETAKLCKALYEHGIYFTYNPNTMKFNIKINKEELTNETK